MLNREMQVLTEAVSKANDAAHESFVSARNTYDETNKLLTKLQLECSNNGGHVWVKLAADNNPGEECICSSCGFSFGP